MKTQNLQQQKMACYWYEPIKFLIRSIEPSLCESSDTFNLVTGNITTTPNNKATQVAFKNYTPFEDWRTNQWHFCWLWRFY